MKIIKNKGFTLSEMIVTIIILSSMAVTFYIVYLIVTALRKYIAG